MEFLQPRCQFLAVARPPELRFEIPASERVRALLGPPWLGPVYLGRIIVDLWHPEGQVALVVNRPADATRLYNRGIQVLLVSYREAMDQPRTIADSLRLPARQKAGNRA